MNTPIAAPMIGSTHVHPVIPHTIAATMTPIDPSVSESTSSDAPFTLRLSPAPGRSSIERDEVHDEPDHADDQHGHRRDLTVLAEPDDRLVSTHAATPKSSTALASAARISKR